VMARGDRRESIIWGDKDRSIFIETLVKLAKGPGNSKRDHPEPNRLPMEQSEQRLCCLAAKATFLAQD